MSTILIGIHLKDKEAHASYFENINFKYLLMFIPENQQVKTDTKYQDGGTGFFSSFAAHPSLALQASLGPGEHAPHHRAPVPKCLFLRLLAPLPTGIATCPLDTAQEPRAAFTIF